ncbi:MAG: MliC family protein [Alphaproteobacteria bacterium]|nr:MliC family protein [Alphaproteobacteria bacterium]
MRPHLIAAAAAALALAACSPPAEKVAVEEQEAAAEATYATPREWACADGQTLTIAFLSDPQRLEIAFKDGGRVILPASEAASGARYSDATSDFHSKGDEAVYKTGGKETICKLSKGA